MDIYGFSRQITCLITQNALGIVNADVLCSQACGGVVGDIAFRVIADAVCFIV